MTIKSDKWIDKKCSSLRVASYLAAYVGRSEPVRYDAILEESVKTDDVLQAIKESRSIQDGEFGIQFSQITECDSEDVIQSVVAVGLGGPMIEPYEPRLVREVEGNKIVSYGTSSYGYDIRCAREFKVFTNINSTIIDPKNFDEKSFVSHEGDFCIIPPNSFALAHTVEYFRIPRNVLAVCLGKSTYARCGIIVNVTPFEPEWEGYVTLEFSNTTPLPAKIYAGEGCAQVLFFESDEDCNTSYKDRNGKYQSQPPLPIPPKV
jgi:dCTP deaminase